MAETLAKMDFLVKINQNITKIGFQLLEIALNWIKIYEYGENILNFE